MGYFALQYWWRKISDNSQLNYFWSKLVNNSKGGNRLILPESCSYDPRSLSKVCTDCWPKGAIELDETFRVIHSLLSPLSSLMSREIKDSISNMDRLWRDCIGCSWNPVSIKVRFCYLDSCLEDPDLDLELSLLPDPPPLFLLFPPWNRLYLTFKSLKNLSCLGPEPKWPPLKAKCPRNPPKICKISPKNAFFF